MKRILKKMASILWTITVVYTFVCIFMYFAQGRLIFPRHMVQYENLDKYPQLEQTTITTPDNASLHGIIYRDSNPSSPILLVNSGNGADVATDVIYYKLHVLPKNFHIMGFNYRGYGKSTGSPTEKNILVDNLLIYDTIKKQFPNSPIIPVGASLGSSVATYIAANRDVAGLVLITPFDSLTKVASGVYPFLPIKWLIRHKFPTEEFIQNIKVPVAVISAINDEVVPTIRTTMLKEVIPNMVYNKKLQASHGDIVLHKNFPKVLRDAISNIFQN